MQLAGSDETNVPLWKNPWALSLVVGIATITLMRPCTRRVPDPPPVIGDLPSWSFAGPTGPTLNSADLSGDVYVMAFFSTRCRGDECNRILNALKDLERKSADADPRFPIVAVNVDWDKDPGALDSWTEQNPYRLEHTRILRGTEAAATPVLNRLAQLKEGVVEAPWDFGLLLIDGDGQLRGFYDTAREFGVDEVAHRAIHIRDRG